MKSHLPSCAAAIAALAFSTAALAQEKVVNVYNWSDYIDSSVLEDFTKETGIKVVYDTYDSNETLETKLLTGKTGYDVVVPTANNLQRQIQAGVYQKLDKSKLPNLKNMWDIVMQGVAKYDPGNQYSVDYMWATTGIGYNIDKVKQISGSDAAPTWDTLFDPKMAAKYKECGIMMLDSPTDVMPSVLTYVGVDPNTTDQAQLKKAGDALKAIRPFVRKFDSSNYISALAQGDICLVLGYSGDIFQARRRAEEAKNGVKVGYTIPAKGAQMWFDVMAIPKDAPHVAEAHALINYLMRPEVAAKTSNFVSYANGNKASQQFINKEILEDPQVYPTPDVMKNLFTVAPWDPKTQRYVTRLWTTVLTGQ